MVKFSSIFHQVRSTGKQTIVCSKICHLHSPQPSHKKDDVVGGRIRISPMINENCLKSESLFLVVLVVLDVVVPNCVPQD